MLSQLLLINEDWFISDLTKNWFFDFWKNENVNVKDVLISLVRHSCKSSADAMKFIAKNLDRGILVAPRTFALQQKDRRVHEYVCSLNYFGYFEAI